MKPKRVFFLITVLFFISGASIRNLLFAPIPFAYDEPDYVANSILKSEFNLGHDVDPVVWSQEWAYDQPHLYHYLTASFLEFRYQQPITIIINEDQLNQRYTYGSPSIIFGKTGDGKMISDLEIADYKKAYQVILVARELSFYFYLIGGIILISIVYFFCHPILAVLVAIFYLNPYFYNISVLAQADGLLILLILVNILLSLLYIKFSRHRLLIAVFLGVNCGLTLSTKLNGGITLISSILSIIFAFLSKRKSRNNVDLGHLALVIGLTFAVFYWLNPYFYSDMVQKTIFMIQHRITIASYQSLMAPNETFPVGLFNKVVVVFRNLYQHTGQTAFFSLVYSTLSTALSFILLFLILVKKIIVKPATLFLLISSTYSFLIILFYIPMNWSRYYYPAIIENMVMTVSIITIIITVRAKYDNKTSPTKFYP